jgi:hypothetical protein
MANDKHVTAVFHEREKADRCLEDLVSKGFTNDQLSLLVSSQGRGKHFEVSDNQTKAPEGVGYGAVLGGLAAALTAAVIPGSIFVAGPIAGAFAAGGAGAAAGGLIGGLIGLGISEDEAQLVESEVNDGSIVVAAHSLDSDEADVAKECFKVWGASRVH